MHVATCPSFKSYLREAWTGSGNINLQAVHSFHVNSRTVMLCCKLHCTSTCTYNFILNLHAENVPTVSSHQPVGGQMAQKDDEPDTLPTPLSGVFCWDCGISS